MKGVIKINKSSENVTSILKDNIEEKNKQMKLYLQSEVNLLPFGRKLSNIKPIKMTLIDNNITGKKFIINESSSNNLKIEDFNSPN